MSGKLKVSKIAELALGKIGAFTVNMVAPDPDELSLAIQWLDIIATERTATMRCFWLTSTTVTSALSANTASYVLSTLLGTSYPSDGILFPISAYIRDSATNDPEIDLISRREYESIVRKSATGRPTKAYIDRSTDTPTIYLWPVPTVATYSLRLIFQNYTPTTTSGSPTNAGNVAHGFPPEWQHWLINSLAAEIGSGPVRSLPPSEVDRIARAAGVSMLALETYANTEKTTAPRRVAAAF